MSHHMFGESANRGECVQSCRREFEVYDSVSDKSLIMGEDYVMSPNDLCTIEFIDQLIEAGIDSFKIEGRKRSPNMLQKLFPFIAVQSIFILMESLLMILKKKC